MGEPVSSFVFLQFWGHPCQHCQASERAGWQGCDWERITWYSHNYECVCVIWRERQKVVITGCVKGKRRVLFTPVAPSLELNMIIMAAIDVLWPWRGGNACSVLHLCVYVCMCASGDFLFMLSHWEYQWSVCVDLCCWAAAEAVCLSFWGEGVTLSSDSVSIKLELSSLWAAVCHNGPGKHCQCPLLLSGAQKKKPLTITQRYCSGQW